MHKLKLPSSIAVFLFFSLLMVGCGHLNRNINQSHLTRGDMVYTNNLGHSNTNLKIDIGYGTFSTNRTASRLIIIPPFFSVKTLGRDFRNYGYMQMNGLLPFFIAAKAAIYNQSGNSTARVNSLTIPFIYGQWLAENETLKSTRYEFLKIPLIGPCFAIRKGPNSGRPRFFWIPGPKK